LPNIFKHFLGPIQSYAFPAAEELMVDDPTLPPDSEQENTPPDGAPEGADDRQGDLPEDSEAASLFSYARVQAEEIVAQARRESEQILEDARQQAAQQAQEALAAAKEEGFRQGYAEGLTKAQAEGKAAEEERLRQYAQQVGDFLEQATQAREELLEQAHSELCDLSVAVAEKIIHVSLKSSREVILQMIRMATQRLRRREWVHIYVGGYDAKQLSQITPELTASLAGLSDHIKVIPMVNDEAGTCIIEMPDEIIDASASTQLQNIREILRNG
jgi:flagellar assembly protein FliH